MNIISHKIFELLDRLQMTGDLDSARTFYQSQIYPIVRTKDLQLSDPLAVALIELKEMLFVHPNLSTPIRDITDSIAVIRDELEDFSSSSSS